MGVVRIALLSPYSWTYPGGVTRHIDSLARELLGAGHDVHILAPLDPDDALSVRLHGGARPQPLRPPDYLHPLGRTVGIGANGAVSNVSLTPTSVLRLREELYRGGFDVLHIHEPVVPVIGWDAMLSPGPAALVGTFHTYSENKLTNGIAAIPLGARRRMSRLHVRIAVSEAASWTARRFYGGRYRVIPNGVHLHDELDDAIASPEDDGGELRIAFIGQAVERKGLPILLRAFEALREHVPATLTIVGASQQEVEHMLLDERGVRALGKVSDERKRAELERADVLCAPSLGGESFGMVLTEAFAASTPVVASDIAGYGDVVRDGVDGTLVAPGDPLAIAEALRRLALEPRRRAQMARAARERAERFAWPHVAREVADCYERAVELTAFARRVPGRRQRAVLRHGFSCADGKPRVPAQPLPSLAPAPAPVLSRRPRRVRTLRRVGLAASSLVGAALAAIALQRVGMARVAESLVASKPGLVLAALALMCTAMFARALSWHAILGAAATWRRASRRDAMQGTFIGVLMSATLPARLGEPSRALIVARRLGRARETLPPVLGSIVSQTLLNLVALGILGGVALSSVRVLDSHGRALLAVALAPVALLVAMALAPTALAAAAEYTSSRRKSRRRELLLAAVRPSLARLRDGLRVFARPRSALVATSAQLGAWALQWVACWVLLIAMGLGSAGGAAAAGVLFAVNVTALLPPTPANVGVFQAACVAVLAGVYHVGTADAIAYGIVLQVVEVTTAFLMGIPALAGEGMSWREVRRRTMHATPARLPALASPPHGAPARER